MPFVTIQGQRVVYALPSEAQLTWMQEAPGRYLQLGRAGTVYQVFSRVRGGQSDGVATQGSIVAVHGEEITLQEATDRVVDMLTHTEGDE